MSKDGAFRRKNGFTAVSNSIVKNENMSMKAKGLYLIIQGTISDPYKDYYKKDFIRMSADGTKSFDSAWNELKNAGLLKSYIQNVNGKFITEYDLLDEPVMDGVHTYYLDKNGNVTKTNLGVVRISDTSVGPEVEVQQDTTHKNIQSAENQQIDVRDTSVKNAENQHIGKEDIRNRYTENQSIGKGDTHSRYTENQSIGKGNTHFRYTEKQDIGKGDTHFRYTENLNIGNGCIQNGGVHNGGNRNNTNIYNTNNIFSSSNTLNTYGDDDEHKDIVPAPKEQIDYESISKLRPESIDMLDNVIDVMEDVYSTRREDYKISGDNVPIADIRNRFKKLTQEHILRVLDSLKSVSINNNVFAYLLSTLYHESVRDVKNGDANSYVGEQHVARDNYNRFNNFHQRENSGDDWDISLLRNNVGIS